MIVFAWTQKEEEMLVDSIIVMWNTQTVCWTCGIINIDEGIVLINIVHEDGNSIYIFSYSMGLFPA